MLNLLTPDVEVGTDNAHVPRPTLGKVQVLLAKHAPAQAAKSVTSEHRNRGIVPRRIATC